MRKPNHCRTATVNQKFLLQLKSHSSLLNTNVRFPKSVGCICPEILPRLTGTCYSSIKYTSFLFNKLYYTEKKTSLFYNPHIVTGLTTYRERWGFYAFTEAYTYWKSVGVLKLFPRFRAWDILKGCRVFFFYFLFPPLLPGWEKCINH